MNLTLSVQEILAILGMLGVVTGYYISLRVKIQKIDTSTQLKILELERQIASEKSVHADWVKDIREMIAQFLCDNKEEHKALQHDTKNIRQGLENIRVSIAELRAMKRTKEYEDET